MAANFLARVSCLTVSKAFARSSETIATYSLSSSIWVVCCWMLISAEVVEPVGLNAYWSFRRLDVALSSKAGYMYLLTISLSVSLQRIGVITDMGRKSEGVAGSGTLATGWMIATIHCFGTIDDDTERLIRWASTRLVISRPKVWNSSSLET